MILFDVEWKDFAVWGVREEEEEEEGGESYAVIESGFCPFCPALVTCEL